MAVPTYTTDLTAINLSTGLWVECAGALEGRITNNDPDNFIAGTDSTTSQTRTGGNVSIATPSAAFTIAAGDAAFMWFYHGAMPTVDVIANHGFQAIVGSSDANYNRFTVHGSDTLPKGGWFNVAIDPTATPTNVQGTPTTTTNTFGSRIFMTGAVSKGNPYAVDYIRHGRSLIVDDGEIANPGTFAGAATQNDLVANRWGLFEAIGGGFSQKGLFQMGTAASLAYFSDTNVSIVIEDSPHVAVGFNEFEVLNASSTMIWTGIQISALGTQSKGLFNVTDNATVTKTGCTFNDMAEFNYLSNSTLVDNTWRRCGTVTQAGSTITGGLITSSPAATALVIDTDTALSGVTLSNNNIAIDATSAIVADVVNIDGCTFNSNTTDITVNSANDITINMLNGSNAATCINTGAGACTIQNAVSVEFTGIVSGSRLFVRATSTVGSVTSGDVLVNQTVTTDPFVYAHNFEGNLPFVYRVRNSSISPYYQPVQANGTIRNTGFSADVQQISDE